MPDASEPVDVLAYSTPEGGRELRAVPAGKGEQVVAAHEREARRRGRVRVAVLGLLAVAFAAGGWLSDYTLAGVGAAVLVLVAARVAGGRTDPVPELLAAGVAPATARERWDVEP